MNVSNVGNRSETCNISRGALAIDKKKGDITPATRCAQLLNSTGASMDRNTLLLPLLLALSSSPAVFGQIESDTARVYEIDEVVITGTRTERKIVDIPYAIDRIGQGEYKYDRKVAVSDVLEFIPGLFLQSRYGNHDVRITMGGFVSRSNSGIRGVRILLDGIPESEPDGQTRIEALDFHSVGAIEVVRGNSSSLYTN